MFPGAAIAKLLASIVSWTLGAAAALGALGLIYTHIKSIGAGEADARWTQTIEDRNRDIQAANDKASAAYQENERLRQQVRDLAGQPPTVEYVPYAVAPDTKALAKPHPVAAPATSLAPDVIDKLNKVK